MTVSLKNRPPAELVALSLLLGADPLLVQGGGGNTSLKADNVLWVKASGTWLAHADRDEVFVALDLHQVRDALGRDDAEARLSAMAPANQRPSIETALHALMPQRCVAHVHCVSTLAYAVTRDGSARLADRLAGLPWAWVPYARPGQPLTAAISDALARGPATPAVLVLANHGLVVAGANAREVETLVRDVERRLQVPARVAPAADVIALEHANDIGWRIESEAPVHGLATDPVALRAACAPPLYPDHAVFLGSRALVLESGEALSAALARHRSECSAEVTFALVPGAGVLVSPDMSTGAAAMLECLAMLGLRLRADDVLMPLPAEEVEALTTWDAEAYRRAKQRAAVPA